MLRSHSPSRSRSQPPKKSTWKPQTAGGRDNGGGRRRHLGEEYRPLPQARTRGPQPQDSAGLRRSRNRSQHKAQSRPASGSPLCPLLPSPSRAAQPEPVPGGGRRGGDPHTARFSDTRAPATRPWRPALLSAQLRGPRAARAEVLRASPIRSGTGSFAQCCSLTPAGGSGAEDSHPAGPHSSSCPWGSAASAAPEPGPAPPRRVAPAEDT